MNKEKQVGSAICQNQQLSLVVVQVGSYQTCLPMQWCISVARLSLTRPVVLSVVDPSSSVPPSLLTSAVLSPPCSGLHTLSEVLQTGFITLSLRP